MAPRAGPPCCCIHQLASAWLMSSMKPSCIARQAVSSAAISMVGVGTGCLLLLHSLPHIMDDSLRDVSLTFIVSFGILLCDATGENDDAPPPASSAAAAAPPLLDTTDKPADNGRLIATSPSPPPCLLSPSAAQMDFTAEAILGRAIPPPPPPPLTAADSVSVCCSLF